MHIGTKEVPLPGEIRLGGLLPSVIDPIRAFSGDGPNSFHEVSLHQAFQFGAHGAWIGRDAAAQFREVGDPPVGQDAPEPIGNA